MHVNNSERLEFNVVSAETFELLNLAVKGLTTLRHRPPVRTNFHSHTFYADETARPHQSVRVARLDVRGGLHAGLMYGDRTGNYYRCITAASVRGRHWNYHILLFRIRFYSRL